ncbi:M1 family aminopeptidase, partial [Prevotella sp.]
MEHPGAIQFTDHEIFLGEHPTPEELQTRVELIAHETAHCWFGDDVTMRWFNDVWTKEVFANFLASKIAKQLFPDVNHDLNFLRMYQTRALSTDRTQGTHPIQQQLDNLNSAGLLYGNIIYQKSPVMMRKLEEQMGASRFRQGLQEYLNTYSYSNATWDELINILDRYAPEAHLKEFSEAWVKQKGMPTVTTQWNDGKLIITQSDPFKRGLTWQQSFLVDAIYINKVENDGAEQTRITTTTIPVDMQGVKKEIALAKRPDYIVPNADGSGYGLFVFDNFDNIPLPTDDLRRFALAMNMYENYLAHGIDAKSLSDTMHSWLKAENNALIASQLVSYWGGAVSAMPDTDRHFQEQQMWQEYRNATIASVKQRLIRQLYNT